MRIVIQVGVTFDVETYEEAGELLDSIDRKIKKTLGGRGGHEITNFQTRPCKAARFNEMADMPTMAREPEYDR